MIDVHGKQVPTELEEFLLPDRSALVVIDMQNDYCSPGGMAHAAGGDVEHYGALARRIASFAAFCRERRAPVVLVRMVSLPEGRSDSPAWLRLRLRSNMQFGRAAGPLDCVLEGSWGAELVPALTPHPTDVVVHKTRSSAFFRTPLESLLRAAGVDTVMVAGCTTEGCVEATVRDASYRDFFPVVLEDCVGSGNPELHEASLKVMSAYRADLAQSNAVIALWHEFAPDPRMVVAATEQPAT